MKQAPKPSPYSGLPVRASGLNTLAIFPQVRNYTAITKNGSMHLSTPFAMFRKPSECAAVTAR
jgi:hypothetical protein